MAKTATKTFRCEKWLAAAIHKRAHSLDISDGEWVCRVLAAELMRTGGIPFDDTQTSTTAR